MGLRFDRRGVGFGVVVSALLICLGTANCEPAFAQQPVVDKLVLAETIQPAIR